MADESDIRYIHGPVSSPAKKIKADGTKQWDFKLGVPWSQYPVSFQIGIDDIDDLYDGDVIGVLIKKGNKKRDREGTQDFHYFWDVIKTNPSPQEYGPYVNRRDGGSGESRQTSSAPPAEQRQPPAQSTPPPQQQESRPPSAPAEKQSKAPSVALDVRSAEELRWTAALQMASSHPHPPIGLKGEVMAMADSINLTARVYYRMIGKGPVPLTPKNGGQPPPPKDDSLPFDDDFSQEDDHSLPY